MEEVCVCLCVCVFVHTCVRVCYRLGALGIMKISRDLGKGARRVEAVNIH